MSALRAPRRLLEEAADEPRFPADRAAVLAAAAVALESGQPGALSPLIGGMRSRGLALLVAASGATAIGAADETEQACDRRKAVVDIAGSTPREDLIAGLAAAECFLARIDPEWAAALVERFIPAEEIVQSGVLGLSIAAFAHDHARVPPWVTSPPPSRGIYARALAADGVARAAARGTIVAKNDPAFSQLHVDPTARLLLSFEASSYLVAAAIVDPGWALDLASAMLVTHSPLDMTDALYFCARSATRGGLRPQMVALSQSGEFVLEQACWIEAAARAGALDRSQAGSLCSSLAARVTDELSEEGATSARMALLSALAHVDFPDLLIELATEWRIPPEVVVDRLFHAAARTGARGLVEREWPKAGATDAAPIDACRDVLVLIGSLPWLATPGSLLDVTCVAEHQSSLLRD